MVSEEVILDVKNLSTHFFTSDGVVKAVNDVSFTLHRGEVVGLVGESGCGKSVTVMSLLQLIPNPPGKIMGGSAIFKGQDLLSLNKQSLQKIRGNIISMIFQDPMTSLNPYMKISAQIMEPLLVHNNINRAQAKKRCMELMEMVGIEDVSSRIDNYPHEFSGGMRQRAMIAMSLACEPDILIADEPTTALDVSVQVQILDLIKDLAKRLGTAVIFITHDLGVVANMCNRVYVMYAGRMIENTDVSRLFANPTHPYTQGLIDSVVQLYEKKEESLKIIEGQPPMLINVPNACLFYPRCKFAMDVCKRERPRKLEVSEKHYVECWLTTQEFCVEKSAFDNINKNITHGK